MIKRISCISLLALLCACGGESTPPAGATNENAATASKNSKLSGLLSEDQICQILSSDTISALAEGATQIKQAPSSYRDTFTCTYTWPRPDAEERQEAFLAATMASMRGEGKPPSIRERMTDYQITVTAKMSKRSANTFVPPVLSEEQIQAQIDAAKKRAAEKLTDEQKAVAGDAANDMVERLLRKNNENQAVDGIGDAAYWSNLATGSLQVLDGNVELSVSPLLSDTKEADLENAKKIATAIVN
jgi:hypothetical protein